ncbi:ABC transporter permease [Streptomyces sp. NPDC049915]|uniref:ABC transporter permease n=1 Tax=Streptomyces sp. NPDC049915 TaxID=3155510 RepID=UPI00342C5CA5
MSAVPLPAPTHKTHAPRHLHWLLRLHRPALLTWAALVLATAAALLWLYGPATDAAAAAWRQWNACDTESCAYDQPAILRYKTLYTYTTIAVTAVPFVVAAWSGAALVGRELESGTARLTWTQGLTPTRWLTGRLALPAALITAGTTLLVILHRLAWTAAEGRIDTAEAWYDNTTLHANGPTTIAFALAGLAAGALAGLLWQRTLPALMLGMALTLVVRTIADQAMPHLWPTATRTTDLRNADLLGDVLYVDEGLVTSTGRHMADPTCGSTAYPDCRALYEKLDAVGHFHIYHPASHYWPLQLTTTALALALTALLTAGAYMTLRRITGGRAAAV